MWKQGISQNQERPGDLEPSPSSLSGGPQPWERGLAQASAPSTRTPGTWSPGHPDRPPGPLPRAPPNLAGPRFRVGQGGGMRAVRRKTAEKPQ